MNITSADLRRAGIRVAGAGTTKGRKKRKPTPIVDTKSVFYGGVASIWFPIRAESEANKREFWAVRNERKKMQQAIVASKRKDLRKAAEYVSAPWHIKLSRYGPRRLDNDNCAISMKGIRDQIAKELGIDDGDESKAKWDYDQEITKSYGVCCYIRAGEVTR